MSLTTACLHCGSRAELHLQATDLNRRIDQEQFNYFRCVDCALVFLHPVPQDLSRYYEGAYPPYSIPGSLADLETAAKPAKWRAELVRQHVHSGRILEIGPSYGGFAYAATKAGFSVDAIEMDGKCCEFINGNIVGARAIHTSNVLEGLSGLGTNYQAAVLWHNVEHLINPWPILDRIVSHVEPGGVVVIATPNPDSFQFRLFKENWVHLDAPRHVGLIPLRTLTAFLVGRGMRLERLTTTDPDGLLLDKIGWGQSIAYASGSRSHRYLWKKILKLVRWILWPFERALRQGAAYTVVYRKVSAS